MTLLQIYSQATNQPPEATATDDTMAKAGG